MFLSVASTIQISGTFCDFRYVFKDSFLSLKQLEYLLLQLVLGLPTFCSQNDETILLSFLTGLISAVKALSPYRPRIGTDFGFEQLSPRVMQLRAVRFLKVQC